MTAKKSSESLIIALQIAIFLPSDTSCTLHSRFCSALFHPSSFYFCSTTPSCCSLPRSFCMQQRSFPHTTYQHTHNTVRQRNNLLTPHTGATYSYNILLHCAAGCTARTLRKYVSSPLEYSPATEPAEPRTRSVWKNFATAFCSGGQVDVTRVPNSRGPPTTESYDSGKRAA